MDLNTNNTYLHALAAVQRRVRVSATIADSRWKTIGLTQITAETPLSVTAGLSVYWKPDFYARTVYGSEGSLRLSFETGAISEAEKVEEFKKVSQEAAIHRSNIRATWRQSLAPKRATAMAIVDYIVNAKNELVIEMLAQRMTLDELEALARVFLLNTPIVT